MGAFSAQVRFFADVYVPEQSERITKAAIREFLRDANRGTDEGGRVPVDTGWLIGSLTVGVNAEPKAVLGVRSRSAWEREFGKARMGDTIIAWWSAPHAVYAEYGHDGVQPAGFLRAVIDRWDAYVKEAVEKYGDA